MEEIKNERTACSPGQPSRNEKGKKQHSLIICRNVQLGEIE